MATSRSKRVQKEKDERREEEDEGGEATGGGDRLSQRRRSFGLRNFMATMEGKQHRVVEMRIAVVCGFGVALRILFLDDVPADTLLSTFILVATCFIVLIFSTWLDYFTTRLRDIIPREAEGQGIPLACLLLPLVSCAANYCAMGNAPQLTGLISLYQILLCVLSVCSVIATLFHAIPHPNHLIFYNFACMGLFYVLYVWLEVPLWPILAGVVIYSAIGPWLLYTFPLSFTLGEAIIISQGATIMFLDTGMQLLDSYGYVDIPQYLRVARSDPILFVEVLVSGGFFCCLVLGGALYKLSVARYHHDKKFWSGTFLLLSASIYFVLIFPYLGRLLKGQGPISFTVIYVFSSSIRMGLVAYWLIVSFVTGLIITAQSVDLAWLAPLRSSDPSSLWMRKWFHLFASLVYLPGVALDPAFLSLASSLVFTLFLAAEVVRYFRMWPIGGRLDAVLRPLTDSRDGGPLVLTHLYLLVGFATPLWLCPLSHYDQASKLAMYAGVLALGIGDSVAAVAGKLMGKTQWPGTTKTVEGTLMAVMTQLLGTLVIVIIDPNLLFFSGRQWLIVTLSLVVTAALEAYTQQVDNLILGLIQFAFLITFL